MDPRLREVKLNSLSRMEILGLYMYKDQSKLYEAGMIKLIFRMVVKVKVEKAM